MEKSFEYLKVQTAMDSVTIENIGNVILSANNDNSFEWILYISTEAGQTTIKEFGPLFRDNEVARFGFNFDIAKIEYNEKGISKRINNFLNNPKREITQVIEIDEYDFEDKLIQAKELL